MKNNGQYYFYHEISYDSYISENLEYIGYEKDIERFHNMLVDTALNYRDMFYSVQSECFNIADYPDVWDQFDAEETEYANTLRDEKEYCEGSIVWHVIIRRIEKQKQLIKAGKGEIDGIYDWLSLFLFYIECGLYEAEDGSYLNIEIGDINTFPKYLLERIADSENLSSINGYLSAFRPFKKEIDDLYRAFNDDMIIKNDLIIGRFFEILYLYKTITETDD